MWRVSTPCIIDTLFPCSLQCLEQLNATTAGEILQIKVTEILSNTHVSHFFVFYSVNLHNIFILSYPLEKLLILLTKTSTAVGAWLAKETVNDTAMRYTNKHPMFFAVFIVNQRLAKSIKLLIVHRANCGLSNHVELLALLKFVWSVQSGYKDKKWLPPNTGTEAKVLYTTYVLSKSHTCILSFTFSVSLNVFDEIMALRKSLIVLLCWYRFYHEYVKLHSFWLIH